MRTKRFNPERKATFNRQILTSFISLIIILMLINPNAFAQVAINTDGSDPSNMAMLDISATTKGLLIPRMTTYQRNKFEDNLTAAEQGMLVYDTETNCFYFYNGTAFDSISNGVIAILQDADKDTKIQVEKTPDADEIIFTMADTAIFKMLPTRLETPGTNVAIGTNALYSNTDRKHLVAIGDSALYYNGTGASNQTHSIQNTAIGSKSLYANTTGYDNTALGYLSMYDNTAGKYNTAVGSKSLQSNTTGDNNAAAGYESLLDNTAGEDNSAFGFRAMYSNTTGLRNTAIGYISMGENITGNYNTAMGSESLANNTSGSSNTCIGRRSLAYNTTGGGNTAMGSNSLYRNTTGSFNTAIGINAMWHNTTGLSNVAIGNSSLYEQESGNFNIAIGAKALYKNDDRSYLIAIGDSALYHNGTGASLSIHSKESTAVGSKSLYNNTTGYRNTAVGFETMISNTTGYQNTAIGHESMINNTEGSKNLAVGNGALKSNTTGDDNSALGSGALVNNTTGYHNTALGYEALSSNITGYGNICIGYHAGVLLESGSKNIFIGYSPFASSASDSEKLNIGNLLFGNGLDGTETTISSGNIGIGNSNPFYKLDISGDDMQLKSSTGGATVYLDGLSGNSTIAFEESNTFRGSMGYNMDDDYLFLYEGGNVVVKNGNLGVGTTTPGYRLQVGSSGDGSEARANAWNTFSDARLKTNLSVIQDPMNKIQQVSGYYYYWKEGEDEDRQVGVIAQEIEAILPEIVSTDAEGIKSVDYSKLTPLLIEAIKAQQEQIQALEARIAEMELN